jgi:hypothetical protein
VHADAEDHVTKIEHVTRSPVRSNGGFFALRQAIFDYMSPAEPGEEDITPTARSGPFAAPEPDCVTAKK